MAMSAVKISEVEGKREGWEALNQESIDQLTESVQRIRIIGRMLLEMDLDKVERGTLAIMLTNESDNIFMSSVALEERMAGVQHV